MFGHVEKMLQLDLLELSGDFWAVFCQTTSKQKWMQPPTTQKTNTLKDREADAHGSPEAKELDLAVPAPLLLMVWRSLCFLGQILSWHQHCGLLLNSTQLLTRHRGAALPPALPSEPMLRQLGCSPMVYRDIRGDRKLPLPYPVALHCTQPCWGRDCGPLSLNFMIINSAFQLHQHQIDVMRM